MKLCLMSGRTLLLILILLAGAAYSLRARKLTLPAALTGVVLALLVYGGAGFTGIIMMTFFFLSASAATSWKSAWKQKVGLAETNKGVRNACQVIANAGIPAFAGLAAMMGARNPEDFHLVHVSMAAAFSAATADTLSSELGNIYGNRYFNILSFKKEQRGLNGVVSLEGTLCGLAGSILVSFIHAVGFGWNGFSVLIIILCGTAGNIFDSVLGATLEKKHRIGNNLVNFLNTAIAALLGWILAFYNL